MILIKKTLTILAFFIFLLALNQSIYAMQGDMRLSASFLSDFKFNPGTEIKYGYQWNDFWETGIKAEYFDKSLIAGIDVMYNFDYFAYIPILIVGFSMKIYPETVFIFPVGIMIDYKPRPWFFFGIGVQHLFTINADDSNRFLLRAGVFFSTF